MSQEKSSQPEKAANEVHQHFRGVFSSQELRKVGTGTTTRKTVTKTFWYAEEEPDGRLYVQPINSNYVPTGNKKYITKDELLAKFSPEHEFYTETVYPSMRRLKETIDRADNARNKGETFSAEYEYDNALAVDVDNVRANFGIGLTYLSRGEKEKAQNIFSRLVQLDGAFEEEHKHLFNEFGINLRKNKMFNESLEYYLRALKLSKHDENLYINIARVYLELKDIPHVVEFIGKALALAPQSEVALKFQSWLIAHKLVTEEQCKAAKESAEAEMSSNNAADEQKDPNASSDADAANDAADAPKDTEQPETSADATFLS